MKKILLTIAVAFAAVQSFANVQLGIRDAVVTAAYSGDAGDVLDEVSSGDALTFELNYKLNERMGIHPSLGIEMGEFTQEEKVSGHKVENYTAYVDLILPVMFRFNFTPGWFAEVGPAMAFNLTTLYWNDDDEDDIKKVKDTETFDLGIAIGAGYVFKFGLGIDARYDIGLMDKYEHVDGAMSRFYIGVSYWFKR